MPARMPLAVQRVIDELGLNAGNDAAVSKTPDAVGRGPVAAAMPEQADPQQRLDVSHALSGLADWKMRIQAEAAEHWRYLRSIGTNPTRASIRAHLLRWCVTNNVKTSGGINPSDGYLRTHVLSGKHWTPPP
jgi:hypothetical protein